MDYIAETVRVKQAATLIPCSEAHVWRLIRTNQIVSWKRGGIRLIDLKSLREYCTGKDC